MHHLLIVASVVLGLVSAGLYLDSPGPVVPDNPEPAAAEFVPPTKAESIDAICKLTAAGLMADTDELLRTTRQFALDRLLPSADFAEYLAKDGEFTELSSASPDTRKAVTDRFRMAAPKEWFDGNASDRLPD